MWDFFQFFLIFVVKSNLHQYIKLNQIQMRILGQHACAIKITSRSKEKFGLLYVNYYIYIREFFIVR